MKHSGWSIGSSSKVRRTPKGMICLSRSPSGSTGRHRCRCGDGEDEGPGDHGAGHPGDLWEARAGLRAGRQEVSTIRTDEGSDRRPPMRATQGLALRPVDRRRLGGWDRAEKPRRYTRHIRPKRRHAITPTFHQSRARASRSQIARLTAACPIHSGTPFARPFHIPADRQNARPARLDTVLGEELAPHPSVQGSFRFPAGSAYPPKQRQGVTRPDRKLWPDSVGAPTSRGMVSRKDG